MQTTNKSGLQIGAGVTQQQGFEFVSQISSCWKIDLKCCLMNAPYFLHLNPEESYSFSDMLSKACLPAYSGIFWTVLFLCFFHKAPPGVCWEP